MGVPLLLSTESSDGLKEQNLEGIIPKIVSNVFSGFGLYCSSVNNAISYMAMCHGITLRHCR